MIAGVICDDYKVKRYSETLVEKKFLIMETKVHDTKNKLTIIKVVVNNHAEKMYLESILKILESTNNQN